MTELKSYATKATAKRGVERACGQLSEDIFVADVIFEGSKGEGFTAKVVLDHNKDEPGMDGVRETLSGFEIVFDKEDRPAEKDPNDLEAPKNAPRGPRGTSTVDGPCYTTWAIADDMPGAKRKDVIAACQAAGVTFYTARTQYQKWSKARKAGDASMPAKKEIQA